MTGWEADLGLLVLRVVVGFAAFYHGSAKLFGWFGGDGVAGATAFFAKLGYRPAAAMAVIAGIIETFGGILLGLGLLTLAAALLLASTLTNVLLLHLANGFNRRGNGFEYELSLLAGVVLIGLVGPGGWSLDAALGIDLGGFAGTATTLDLGGAWGLVAIAVGIAAGLIVSATRRRTKS